MANWVAVPVARGLHMEIADAIFSEAAHPSDTGHELPLAPKSNQLNGIMI
jgi:hypothetical protein